MTVNAEAGPRARALRVPVHLRCLTTASYAMVHVIMGRPCFTFRRAYGRLLNDLYRSYERLNMVFSTLFGFIPDVDPVVVHVRPWPGSWPGLRIGAA
jgi:hypothetical protein